MTVPQRLSTVTLGARSVPALRAFYTGLGWRENDGSDDTYASFTMGGVRLGLYPLELLGEEAAPQLPAAAASDTWTGVTLAVTVTTRDAVDEALASAAAADGHVVGSPAERAWGGYSGYFADPEGHRWEIAWAPWFAD